MLPHIASSLITILAVLSLTLQALTKKASRTNAIPEDAIIAQGDMGNAVSHWLPVALPRSLSCPWTGLKLGFPAYTSEAL